MRLYIPRWSDRFSAISVRPRPIRLAPKSPIDVTSAAGTFHRKCDINVIRYYTGTRESLDLSIASWPAMCVVPTYDRENRGRERRGIAPASINLFSRARTHTVWRAYILIWYYVISLLQRGHSNLSSRRVCVPAVTLDLRSVIVGLRHVCIPFSLYIEIKFHSQ